MVKEIFSADQKHTAVGGEVGHRIQKGKEPTPETGSSDGTTGMLEYWRKHNLLMGILMEGMEFLRALDE